MGVIRDVRTGDAERICGIYNYYIRNTVITFEEEELSVPGMEDRIRNTAAAFPWLVFEDHGRIAGYAYAARWKSRSSYRHTVESTVYLSREHRGRGIGTLLYEGLIHRLKNL